MKLNRDDARRPNSPEYADPRAMADLKDTVDQGEGER